MKRLHIFFLLAKCKGHTGKLLAQGQFLTVWTGCGEVCTKKNKGQYALSMVPSEFG